MALDLETTGFDPTVNEIIEVGLIKFNEDGVLDRWSSLVKIEGKLPDEISELTGISSDELILAPDWGTVSQILAKKMADVDVIIGHNINFDLSFLKQAGVRIPRGRIIDTWYLANMLILESSSYSLSALTKLIKREHDAHRALADSQAVVDLFAYLTERLGKISDVWLEKIIKVLAKGDWPYAFLFEVEKEKRSGYCVRQKLIRLQPDIKQIPAFPEIDTDVILAELEADEARSGLAENDVLVVSREIFRYWHRQRAKSEIMIDRQFNYLCRHKLRQLVGKWQLSDVEIGFIVKILIKLESGWDGYLNDLRLTSDEWEMVEGLRCGQEGVDHGNCFYSAKFKINGRKIVTKAVTDSLIFDRNRLWFWTNRLTWEDGMMDLTEVMIRRSSWDNYLYNLEAGRWLDHDQISDLRKEIDLFWGMGSWLIKSEGVEREGGWALDLTPSIFQDMAMRNIQGRIEKIIGIISRLNSEDWQQNLGIWHRELLLFCRAWQNDGEMMMSGMLINDEVVYRMWPRHFSRSLIHRNVRQTILSAPVMFFNDKFYPERFALENQSKVQIGTKRRAKVELIRDNSPEKYWEVLDRYDLAKSVLFVFSNRDKVKTFLENIKFSDYYDLVIKQIGNRYDLESSSGEWRVATVGKIDQIGLGVRQFELVYLDSLPFDVPDSLMIGYRSLYFQENSFRDYYLARMYQKFFSLMNLIAPDGLLLVGDERMATKQYGRDLLNILNYEK